MNEKVELEKILNLEYRIYSPILKKSGINITKEQRQEALKKPQSILTHYVNNKLIGIFRFSQEQEKAFILSLLYDSKETTLPKIFIKEIILNLKNKNIKILESVVQRSNLKSLKFHQKLGFNISKEYPKAIRFQMNFNEILKKFEW
jgi:hypothetical protein